MNFFQKLRLGLPESGSALKKSWIRPLGGDNAVRHNEGVFFCGGNVRQSRGCHTEDATSTGVDLFYALHWASY